MPMWNLEEAWEQRWCPIVPGLLFPDGSVVPFAPGPAGSGAPAPGARARVGDHAGGHPVPWTTIEPLARAVSPDRALIAAAGDGGRDGDGFVALIGGPLGALVWLAFFDDSGPFQAVRFDGDAVVARTAAGRDYRFPLVSPERVVVTAP